MPVEIKELVIRAVVNNTQSSADDDESGQSADSGGSLDNDVIVQECVRQVMQLLARNRER